MKRLAKCPGWGAYNQLHGFCCDVSTCGIQGQGQQLSVGESSMLGLQFPGQKLDKHPLCVYCGYQSPQYHNVSHLIAPTLTLHCPGCRSWS